MPPLTDFLQFIGLFTAVGGGGVALAYGIFKKFGEKWLDARFEERLAAYRHAQGKEIEQLRFQINALLDRAVKLHQREFDVMPEAWAKVNDAFWSVSVFVSPMQSYPDLDHMASTQLEEFLAASELNEWEKTEVLAGDKKTQYYIEHIFWHRLNKTKAVARESHVYLTKNGIFLPPEIKALFVRLDTLIWDALDEHEQGERYKVIPRESKKQQELRANAQTLLKDLETLVQARLWNSERVAA